MLVKGRRVLRLSMSHANIQAPKVSKKKQVKASLGQVGKAAKKVNLGGYGEDDDLGADFDDFM